MLRFHDRGSLLAYGVQEKAKEHWKIEQMREVKGLALHDYLCSKRAIWRRCTIILDSYRIAKGDPARIRDYDLCFGKYVYRCNFVNLYHDAFSMAQNR